MAPDTALRAAVLGCLEPEAVATRREVGIVAAATRAAATVEAFVLRKSRHLSWLRTRSAGTRLASLVAIIPWPCRRTRSRSLYHICKKVEEEGALGSCFRRHPRSTPRCPRAPTSFARPLNPASSHVAPCPPPPFHFLISDLSLCIFVVTSHIQPARGIHTITMPIFFFFPFFPFLDTCLRLRTKKLDCFIDSNNLRSNVAEYRALHLFDGGSQRKTAREAEEDSADVKYILN